MLDVLRRERCVARECAFASLALRLFTAPRLLLFALCGLVVALVRRDLELLALLADELALELRHAALQLLDALLVLELLLAQLPLQLRQASRLSGDELLLLAQERLLPRHDLAELGGATLELQRAVAPYAVVLVRELHDHVGSQLAIRVDPLREQTAQRRGGSHNFGRFTRSTSMPSSSIVRSVASSFAVLDPGSTRGIRKRPFSSRL